MPAWSTCMVSCQHVGTLNIPYLLKILAEIVLCDGQMHCTALRCREKQKSLVWNRTEYAIMTQPAQQPATLKDWLTLILMPRV